MNEPIVYGLIFLCVLLLAYQIVSVRFTLNRVEQKLNRVMAALKVDPAEPVPLSDRVKEAARDPARKIEAIRLLREETGLGLAEAKAAVEAYTNTLY
jgi:ribosomal protein L7/L12